NQEPETGLLPAADHLHQLDHHRQDGDEQYHRKNEQPERYDHLDRKLVGRLLAAQQALVPHLVAEPAQRVADVAAELDRLPQHRDERAGLVEAQAIGERVERLHGAAAGADLGSHHLEVGSELAAALGDLAGDAIEGGFEAQPGIDTDHEEIEQIGKYLPIALRERALPPYQIKVGSGSADEKRDRDQHQPQEGRGARSHQLGGEIDESGDDDKARHAREQVVAYGLSREITGIEQLAPQF